MLLLLTELLLFTRLLILTELLMLSNVGGGGSLAVDDRGLVVDDKRIGFYFDDGLLRLFNGSYIGPLLSG